MIPSPPDAGAPPAPPVAADAPPPPGPADPGKASAGDATIAYEAAEDAAWADVLAGWEDEGRHRAYLERFHDLEGLATAGRRYRDALAARPGDPLAARFRDEVLKRAVAHGLASLPRVAPELPRAKVAVRVAAGVVIGALLLVAAIMAFRLLPFVSGAHP